MSANPGQLALLSTSPYVVSHADVSACGTYRTALTRIWGTGPIRVQGWVMLNPSTADGTVDDPTIRRVVAFARRDGFGGIRVVNLFTLRATNPEALAAAVDPVGPDCDWAIRSLPHVAHQIVVAWGAQPIAASRAMAAVNALAGAEMWSLGQNADRSPKHPLYVRGDTPLVRWL